MHSYLKVYLHLLLKLCTILGVPSFSFLFPFSSCFNSVYKAIIFKPLKNIPLQRQLIAINASLHVLDSTGYGVIIITEDIERVSFQCRLFYYFYNALCSLHFF